MNLREGAFGVQEGMSMVAIAVFVDGVFAAHGEAMYRDGNASYLTALLSCGLSLGVFLLVLWAMERSGRRHLPDLLAYAFGPAGKMLAGVLLSFILLLAAGAPIERFLLMFSHFIFVDESNWKVMVFIAAGVIVLACMGAEVIARTARILVWVLALSVLAALLIAVPGYEWYRLEPVLGSGVQGIVSQSVRNTYRFFAPLCSWLCLTRGAQGLRFTRKAGVGAMIGAGSLSSLTQLCLGLTFPYYELASMHSPMYRLTTLGKGNTFQRLDVLLLFFWLLGAVLGAALHTYAAALLLARLFGQRDIRPAVISAGITATALALMGHLNIPWFKSFGIFVSQYGWLFLLLPLTVAAATALCRSALESRKEKEQRETQTV